MYKTEKVQTVIQILFLNKIIPALCKAVEVYTTLYEVHERERI